MKIVNLNFLEHSGTLRACNGIALPLPLHVLAATLKMASIRGRNMYLCLMYCILYCTTNEHSCVFMIYVHITLVVVLPGLFLYSNPHHPVHPTFRLAQAIFKPNPFPYTHPNILNTSTSSHLPAYEDGTHTVYRNVGINNSAAAQFPIRKHTTKHDQLDRSRSTAAASRHTCCSERHQAHIPVG